MRQRLVAGNWKMYGSREQARALVTQICEGVGQIARVEMAICPPFVYLSEVAGFVKARGLSLGAQDVCERAEQEGAFTGEISALMLADVGCRYVIVGHSERRGFYAESDVCVADKMVAAQAAKLIPIVCVGERLEEREQGITEQVVMRQLNALFARTQGNTAWLDHVVIAYEPVWAIGTGKTATPEQAQHVHAFIRKLIAGYDRDRAAKVKVLYGGSVKASNAADLFSMPDIDGGLIGGASLRADEFLAIANAAQR